MSSNPEQGGYNITGPLEEIVLESRFVSSTEVVCGPPSQDRPYLISVSNVNSTTLRSNPLLWVPYDPACYNCSAKDQYCFMKVSQAIWRNVESFMLMEEGGRGGGQFLPISWVLLYSTPYPQINIPTESVLIP